MKDWKTELTKILTKALKGKDTVKVNVIKLLKTDLINEEIKNNREELTKEQVDAVIQHSAKRCREAIEEFKKVGKLDRVKEEKKELKILMEFMPKQLDKKELIKVIDKTIKENKAKNMEDFGKVMGSVMGKVKGKAEGKLVQELVRKKLLAK